MKSYPLAPNGVFWTLQGEGALLGEPMVFLRLAGCSVGCPQCDTDYRVDRRLTLDECVKEAWSVVPSTAKWWPRVWITGGEPSDHDISSLIEAFHKADFRVCVATSGVREIPLTYNPWLSVSPHTPNPVLQYGHELKVVPGLNGLSWDDVAKIHRFSFPYRFMQPLADGSNLQACIDWVLSHPGWRLTPQAHKLWGLP